MGKKEHSINPADKWRKVQKKREKGKNKEKRKEVRTMGLLRVDTSLLKEQISKIEAMEQSGTADKLSKNKKKQMQETLDKAIRKKQELLVPTVAEFHESFLMPAVKSVEELEREHVQRYPHPELSLYYHPVFNPLGAPPPGKPMVYKELPGFEGPVQLENGQLKPYLALTSSAAPIPEPGSPTEETQTPEGKEEPGEEEIIDFSSIPLPQGPPPPHAKPPMPRNPPPRALPPPGIPMPTPQVQMQQAPRPPGPPIPPPGMIMHAPPGMIPRGPPVPYGMPMPPTGIIPPRPGMPPFMPPGMGAPPVPFTMPQIPNRPTPPPPMQARAPPTSMPPQPPIISAPPTSYADMEDEPMEDGDVIVPTSLRIRRDPMLKAAPIPKPIQPKSQPVAKKQKPPGADEAFDLFMKDMHDLGAV